MLENLSWTSMEVPQYVIKSPPQVANLIPYNYISLIEENKWEMINRSVTVWIKERFWTACNFPQNRSYFLMLSADLWDDQHGLGTDRIISVDPYLGKVALCVWKNITLFGVCDYKYLI